MLFKHYFWLQLFTIAGYCQFFFLFTCFFSVGDPGLPRYIKLRAFGIFHELFFILKIIISVGVFFFLYLYLLIKPFKIVVKVPRVYALACLGLQCFVFRMYCAQKRCCFLKMEWYHLIVKEVVKYQRSDKSIKVPEIL